MTLVADRKDMICTYPECNCPFDVTPGLCMRGYMPKPSKKPGVKPQTIKPMGVLSYYELCELVEQGVINAPLSAIRGVSIDLTLDNIILLETHKHKIVRLAEGDTIDTYEHDLDNEPYLLKPNQVFLGATRETFNLPDDICAQLVTRSSTGRVFLDHMSSNLADPGWRNSKLTLELKSALEWQTLEITTGLACAQMIFTRVAPVPEYISYANTGRYNNQHQVTPSRGLA